MTQTKENSDSAFGIEISWPSLGVSVIGELAHDQNPELVEEFIRHLPFRSLFLHPVAGGEIVYTWAPMVSLAPVRVRVPVRDAPEGQMRYSPNGGNKFGFQYGASAEPSLTPLLGQIVAQDLPKLQLIGRMTWESVFWRKQPIFVEVRRLGTAEQEPDTSFRDTLTPILSAIYDEAVLMQSVEPDDIYQLRHGQVEGGSYNQFFSVWHMAHSQLHSFAVSSLTPILKLLDELPVDQFKSVFEAMVPSTQYLGFLAFKRLHEHQVTIRQLIHASNDREEIRTALIVLMRYALRLCSWSFFHFPWYLGTFYPRAGSSDYLPGRVMDVPTFPAIRNFCDE